MSLFHIFHIWSHKFVSLCHELVLQALHSVLCVPPHTTSTLPGSLLPQKVHLCSKRKGQRHVTFAQAMRWDQALHGNLSATRPSSLLPRVLQREKRALKMDLNCRSETSIFYYYKNIFQVSYHTPPGISSPEWTLKVLLIYQALIGHDIKHTHLL